MVPAFLCLSQEEQVLNPGIADKDRIDDSIRLLCDPLGPHSYSGKLAAVWLLGPHTMQGLLHLLLSMIPHADLTSATIQVIY